MGNTFGGMVFAIYGSYNAALAREAIIHPKRLVAQLQPHNRAFSFFRFSTKLKLESKVKSEDFFWEKF
jgi:hypothetical protein